MSTDAPFKPPRKKHSVMWWIGGLFFLLFLFFLLQLFGPNPPIVVSPATTFITEPLAANGLPNYEQYILQKSREGVTPENNAAALLWPALWPGELDPPQYAAVAAELGLNGIPSTDDALQGLYSKTTQARIADWLRKQTPPPASPVVRSAELVERPDPATSAADSPESAVQSDESYAPENDTATEQVIDRAMECPWTSAQIPPLAKWVAESQKPLDLMLEASHRPRCYFPSPSLIDDNYGTLINMMLPGVQSVRGAGRSLNTRAMWHVGEGRPNEAWQDLLAACRIGQLTAQGPTLVEHLVGIAISENACNGTVTMLHHGNPTAAQARQVMHDLGTLEDFSGMADSIDQMERASYLDTVIQFSQGNDDNGVLNSVGIDNNVSYVKIFAIDWNIVLRNGNRYYDRFAAAARLPDHASREQAISLLENEVAQRARDLGADSLVAAVLSPSARSDAVASILLGMFLPSIRLMTSSQDRGNTDLELTRLAAALAVHRAEQGSYPAKLDDLVPGVLDKVPVDLYNSQPFIYKRLEVGYLLYSAGDNGQDDGGSNEQTRIWEGRLLDDVDTTGTQSPQPEIPSGADDASIRVPRPAFQLPKPQPTE